MDRHLKSNTVKTRTHSLFRQGAMLYDLIPTMPEHRLRPLMERYAEFLQQSRVAAETFAIIQNEGIAEMFPARRSLCPIRICTQINYSLSCDAAFSNIVVS